MIFLAAFLVLIEAFFTALEVALDAVPRARLRELVEESGETARDNSSDEGVRKRAKRVALRAETALRLTERGENLGLLFIFVTTLCLWTAAALVTAHGIAHQWPWWSLVGAFVVMLFFAEVLPLLVAARRAEGVALALCGSAQRALRVFSPILWLLGRLGHGLAHALGAAPQSTTQVTPDELRTALAAAEEQGVIESEERAMLEGALSVRNKCVRDVMTARVDVVGVPLDAPLPKVLEIALDEGHSRLPVFGATGEIVGILATKDLLPHLRAREAAASVRAQGIMREPFILAGEETIARSLESLRRQRSLMAVVEENGQAVGLVTLEDLLEEIVGEIEDEWDEEPQARIEWSAPASAPEQSTVEFDRTPESERAFVVVCDGAISLREAARVWREAGGGLLRLRESDGHLAQSGESLCALATELFAAANIEMVRGASLRAGDAVPIEANPNSDDADEAETRETPPQPVELLVREIGDANATFSLRLRGESEANG